MKAPLTGPAFFTGILLAAVIYAGGGVTSLAMMMAFFVLGTAATSWGKDRKKDIRSNAVHQSTRRTGQVLANAGVAGLAALLNALMGGREPRLLAAIAGCF